MLKDKEEKEEFIDEEEFCYYSGLPSPLAYQDLEETKNKENENNK